MDYGRRELSERLAADYVAGTLRGRARRRFEALLAAHPALRDAVVAWQALLMPLTQSIAPVEPPPHVWQAIEARIGGLAAPVQGAAPASGWWQRLALWRGLAGIASVAAIALALVLAQPAPVQPPLVVVLAATSGAAEGQGFVAGVSADGRAVVTKPIVPVSVAADRALELWAVPPQGAPKSLGLISEKAASVVRRERVPSGTAALAVSLEPPGGSPTGVPTGPVLYAGKLTP
jgi:anti-sigma-K factor RskA